MSNLTQLSCYVKAVMTCYDGGKTDLEVETLK